MCVDALLNECSCLFDIYSSILWKPCIFVCIVHCIHFYSGAHYSTSSFKPFRFPVPFLLRVLFLDIHFIFFFFLSFFSRLLFGYCSALSPVCFCLRPVVVCYCAHFFRLFIHFAVLSLFIFSSSYSLSLASSLQCHIAFTLAVPCRAVRSD